MSVTPAELLDSEPPECLLCGIAGAGTLVSPRLRDDGSGRHDVRRCHQCGHTQIHPIPSEEEDEVFQDQDLQTINLHGAVDVELMRRKCDPDDRRRQAWLSSLVGPADGRVLDVGCGYGFFVHMLVGAGYDAWGIDASGSRLTAARGSRRGHFIEGRVDPVFAEERSGEFSAVTAFHVIEHVREPVTFLRSCAALLAPGGFLLIEVPNLADDLLQTCQPYSDFYWQRAHLSYFDAVHLEMLFDKAGLGNFEIAGVQRYGLGNLLHWIEHGTPQTTNPDHHARHPLLARAEQLYRADRQASLTCDTLIAKVRV